MPAILPITNLDLLPNFNDLFFVVRIDVVNVITTEVGLYLDGAVITPMPLTVPDDMTKRTRESPVITMGLKFFTIQIVDAWNKTEVGSVGMGEKVGH